MLAILILGSASITVFSGLGFMYYLSTSCKPKPLKEITVELTPSGINEPEEFQGSLEFAGPIKVE